MPNEVPAPTQVLTLVLLAWAAGTAGIGAWSRTWGDSEAGDPPRGRPARGVIQPGHFKVIWLVVTGLLVLAGFGYRPAWIAGALSLVAFVAIYRGADTVVGIVAGAAAVAAFVAGAYSMGLEDDRFALAASIPLLLGAVTNAMLLGHWHLNQPRLGTKPILRLVWWLWLGLGVAILAFVQAILRGVAGAEALGVLTALAFSVFAAMLTAVVHHLVRTRSIMSATGILYLQVLLCLVAAFTGSLAALA